MARPTDKARSAVSQIGYSPQWNIINNAIDSLIPTRMGMEMIIELELMALTDETVGSMLWCIQSTMGQIEWKHTPQVDGIDDDKDPEAVRLAAWADTILGDMTQSFDEHVVDALTLIWAGFAPCEIVLKQRDGVDSNFSDRFYGVSQIPLREQSTIWSWDYDQQTQQPISFHQSSVWGSATIPLWKTCNYRINAYGNRPQGRPLLLNAYRVWKLKNRIQDNEAIGIERDLCGLPLFKMPEADMLQAQERDGQGAYTPAALSAQSKIQNAIKAVKDMRFNKSGGLVLPSDTFSDDGQGDKTAKYDFKLVSTAGQRSIDTRTAARDYDRAIARVAMMQFLHLGDRSTGSYSLSDDQSTMAIRSLMALAKIISDEWRRKTLKLLWMVNSFDLRRMPRLKPSEISKEGAQALGNLLAGIGKSGALWETDLDVRLALLRTLGLPADRNSQKAAADQATENAKLQPQGGAKPPVPADEEGMP